MRDTRANVKGTGRLSGNASRIAGPASSVYPVDYVVASGEVRMPTDVDGVSATYCGRAAPLLLTSIKYCAILGKLTELNRNRLCQISRKTSMFLSGEWC